MAINWEQAPVDATHHYKDGWSEWWFKEVGPGRFDFWKIGMMDHWSVYPCRIEDLDGIITPINGKPAMVKLGGVPQPRAAALAEQPAAAPKKSVGWW